MRAWPPGGHGREEEQGSVLGAFPGHQELCSRLSVLLRPRLLEGPPCANRSSGQGPRIQTNQGLVLRGGAQRWGLPLVPESAGAPGRGFLTNLADALGGGLEKSIDPESCRCPGGKRGGRGQGPVSGSLSECPASERHFLLVELPGLLGCTVQEALCPLLLLPGAGHWGCRNKSGHPMREKDVSTELTQGAWKH